MPEALPEQLVTYLAQREAQRATAVTEFLAKLTPRERGLVHDAAVMGYAQGLMRDRSEGAPRDGETINLVIDACLAIPDKYPTVTGIARASAHQPVWQVETRRPRGWTHWSPEHDDKAEARAEYESCVARDGHRRAYRLVRSDTTRVIEAQHDPEQQDQEA
ncbi:hypothetical protein AB0M00_43590 [Streptomyces chartreusis]|uniref:hypothetical protein n=1 Tax=Streptomyces chartreusis TaxID=1969 RepID=UPI0034444EA0